MTSSSYLSLVSISMGFGILSVLQPLVLILPHSQHPEELCALYLPLKPIPSKSLTCFLSLKIYSGHVLHKNVIILRIALHDWLLPWHVFKAIHAACVLLATHFSRAE